MFTRLAAAALLGLVLFAPPPAVAEERRQQGNLVIEGVPEIPADLADRMLQYLNTRSAAAWDWDPAGSGILIFTRFGETTQVHRVQGPGRYREQLTFFPEPVAEATANPDPKRRSFLFTKDIGGNEFYQIYHFDMATGRFRLLTDGKARFGSATWANAGDRFAYHSTQRNGTDWDLWVADPLQPASAKMVLSQGGSWGVLDWSPDDTKLLVMKDVSINETYLYVLDLATGAAEARSGRPAPPAAAPVGGAPPGGSPAPPPTETPPTGRAVVPGAAAARRGRPAPPAGHRLGVAPEGRALTPIRPSADKISFGWGLFSKDGEGVWFTSDEGSEFRHLRYLDLASGEMATVTAGIPWDVEDLELSEDGRTLAFTANEDGIERVYLVDTAERSPRRVAGLPEGVVDGLRFDSSGQRLALSVNSSTTPGDVFVLDVGSGKSTRWTFSEVGGLDPATFVEPTLVRYPTFDGRPIPAFCYKPRGKGPFPVVISIHGGPESQFQPYFSSLNQFLVNELGVAVLAPNVRGSSGYGKSYLKLDNGFLREDSVKDIGALLDWVARQPDLDAGRVAVMGGSYGGYMTLASMTHYNDRLRAGVDVVGISNFVTFLENTQDYRRDLRRVEYGDERDPKMREHLQAISPTTNAHKISIPLFVVQGKNDPRVPVTEAEQMVAVVRRNGRPVWYLMATDEGHGFRKKVNRDVYLQSVVLFLQKHLLAP